MWWLLKMLVIGPVSRRSAVAAPSNKRLDEIEDAIASLTSRLETVRGNVLTQSRRITRLQAELDPDEEDSEDEIDEIDRMIQQRKGGS